MIIEGAINLIISKETKIKAGLIKGLIGTIGIIGIIEIIENTSIRIIGEEGIFQIITVTSKISFFWIKE